MSGLLNVRRPLEADRWILLDWRNQEDVRAVSVNEELISKETHSSWFDKVLSGGKDLMLIVEWNSVPVGVVRIENLDPMQGTASWGCQLGAANVPPGLGASLPLLGLAHGFERLGLRKMNAVVMQNNANMQGIHRRLKLPSEGVYRRQVLRQDGSELDLFAFGIHRDDWSAFYESAIQMYPTVVRGEIVACVSSFTSR